MKAILSLLGCVVVILLAVSVWHQLVPTTQSRLVTLWMGLVSLLARIVESLVSAASR